MERFLGRINADTNDLRTILLSFLGATSEIIALWQLHKFIIIHSIPLVIVLQLILVGTFVIGFFLSEFQRTIRLKKEVSALFLPIRSLLKLLSLVLFFLALPYLSPLVLINLQFLKHAFRIILTALTRNKFRARVLSWTPWTALTIGLVLVSLCPPPAYPSHLVRNFLYININSKSWGMTLLAILMYLGSMATSTFKHFGGIRRAGSNASQAKQVMTSVHVSHWFQYGLALVYLLPVYLIFFFLNSPSAQFPGLFLTVKIVLYGILYIALPAVCNQIQNVLARKSTHTLAVPTSSTSLMMGDETSANVFDPHSSGLITSRKGKMPNLEYRMLFCFMVSGFFMVRFANVFYVAGYIFLFFAIIEFETGTLSKLRRSHSSEENRGNLLASDEASKGFNILFFPFLFVGSLAGFVQRHVVSFLKTVFQFKESRDLFLFLLLNIFFMLIEFFYGFYTNSLGLIADSVHMLFDCSALSVGLYGSIMKKWPRNKEYTYGYGRYETLSAFVNGALLVFTSLFVFCEALKRIVDPPQIYTKQLLTVSILGLIVNLIGVVFFYFHESAKKADTKAVLLHMIADTLGSVGVITSTVIIMWKGLLIADPLCSFLISFVILYSSYQLISESVSVLSQCKSPRLEENILEEMKEFPYGNRRRKLDEEEGEQKKEEKIQGVVNTEEEEEDVKSIVVEKFRSWSYNSDECVVTAELVIPKEENEQIVLDYVTSLLKDKEITHTCVQVRKM